MASSENSPTVTADREIVISRLINARRELVFKAWTDREQVDKWWGPRGFTNTTHAMDVRVGGVWSYTMHHDQYGDFENRIVYLEIVGPERLVYDHGGDDGKVQFRTTVTFEARDDKTLLTMRSVFSTAEARDHVVREFGAIEGGEQHLDCLEEFLAAREGA